MSRSIRHFLFSKKGRKVKYNEKTRGDNFVKKNEMRKAQE